MNKLQEKVFEDERAENCQCGMTEQGVWSESLFDSFGCDCLIEKEENDENIYRTRSSD